MTDDPRCCGSGTCIIDTEGRCWCGQQWNGNTLCSPADPGAPQGPPAAVGPDAAETETDLSRAP